jgi:hypothetical protein
VEGALAAAPPLAAGAAEADAAALAAPGARELAAVLAALAGA